MASVITATVLLSCLLVSTALGHSALIKHNADGSMSSNSGPPSILEHWRSKRYYYYYWNPPPTTAPIANGISNEDAQIIVDEHNKYRKTVSDYSYSMPDLQAYLPCRSLQATCKGCIGIQH